MIKINQDYINDLKSRKIEKIKIYFYGSGCSGTKVGVDEKISDFNNLVLLDNDYGILIYTDISDNLRFENSIITRVEVADHTGKVKTSFIYNSSEVKDRCGCGSSFAFEKKLPKIDLEKLKKLKKTF